MNGSLNEVECSMLIFEKRACLLVEQCMQRPCNRSTLCLSMEIGRMDVVEGGRDRRVKCAGKNVGVMGYII